jgi:hypothetical protein
MHADAQQQPVRLGAQSLLDGNGAAQCLHGAGEGGEEAVAGSLEQPAAVCGSERSKRSVRNVRTRANVAGSSFPTIAE